METYDDIFTDVSPSPSPPAQSEAFDKQAWGQGKQQERDGVYALLDQTALDVAQGQMLTTYLDVQSRLPALSANNALLIAAQKPDATQLRSFEDWDQQGISVKKGEKSVSLLGKGEGYTKEDGSTGIHTRIKKVFDAAQTSAELPAPPDIQHDDRLLLKALIHKSPVPIQPQENLNGHNAVYDPAQQTIFVQKGMLPHDIFRAVSRELSVAALDKMGQNREGTVFPAQCASYLLCKRYGVEPGPVGLSDSLRTKSAQDIRTELAKVRDTAGQIDRRMKEVLDPGRADKKPPAQGR